ncbi:hypothetical protein Tco_1261013 [Tanacetum coccineum]
MAKRLCLVDDLKMLKITLSNTSSRNKLNPEINDHYNILTGECQKDELKTKDKAFQNQRDLPRDIPLDSVEVLRYDVKRSKSENKGIVSTEMELVLELTQQGTSHEVSVSTEGVKELKRKVKIKGEKKEALLTLRQKPGQYIFYQNHKDDC